MYVEQLKENDDIVNVNTIKVFKLTKFSIYYSLNVDEQIFEFYNNNIELFFVLISNKENLCLSLNIIKNCKKKLIYLSNLFVSNYEFKL